MEINLLAAFFMLLNLLILGTRQIRALINNFALQGISLGFLTFYFHPDNFWILAPLVILLKVLIFPIILHRSLAQMKGHHYSTSYISFERSLGIGLIVLLIALPMCGHWAATLGTAKLVLCASCFAFFVGVFIILSRKKAITQLLGYLILENGLFLFSFILKIHLSLLVELFIFFDLFIALIIMYIAIKQINMSFNHTDIDQMKSLQG